MDQPQREDYAPYHTYAAFAEGVRDYMRNVDASTHYHGAELQAYDRGAEYAMRLARYADRTR